jgi:magnesium and cobalt transporter
MGDDSDGHASAGLKSAEDGDPDSPGKPASFFARLFRRDPSDEDQHSDTGAGHAGVESDAREMLVNLRNMRRLRVDDISIPRTEIVGVSEDASLDELVAAFQSSTLSRLPVYRDTLDQPVGLVHLKDLALTYGFGANGKPLDLKGLLRPLLYAPPSMPVAVLLQKMRAARIHMALVIDEYGGVDGLVTIEDIVEEIVGDIADEHDEAENDLWFEEAPGVYMAQARLELDDFEEAIGQRLAEGDLDEEVDTLGGLVIRLAGRLPARGEVVVHPDGHEFEIVDADARRIKRLRVRLKAGLPRDAAAEAAE